MNYKNDYHHPDPPLGYTKKETSIKYKEGEIIDGVYCQYFGTIYNSGILELDCTPFEGLKLNDGSDLEEESEIEILETPSPVPKNVEVIDIEDESVPNQTKDDNHSSSIFHTKKTVREEHEEDYSKKTIKKELVEDNIKKTRTKEHEESHTKKSAKKDHQVVHAKKSINEESVEVSIKKTISIEHEQSCSKKSIKKEHEGEHKKKSKKKDRSRKKSRSKRDYAEGYQSGSDISEKSTHRKREKSKKRYSRTSSPEYERKVFKNRHSHSPPSPEYERKVFKNRHSHSSPSPEYERKVFKNRHSHSSPSPEYERKVFKNRHSRSPQSPQYHDEKIVSKEEYSHSPPQYYEERIVSKKKYSRSSSPQYYEEKKVTIKKDSRSPSPNNHSEPTIKEEPYEIQKPQHLFGSYPCNDCNIVMNSEGTYLTHINGKRHLKNIRAKTILEAAAKNKPIIPKEVREGMPKYPPPPVGVVRKQVNDRAKMQDVVENFDLVCPGLHNVIEIQGISELTYYCKFCDSVCSSNSIIPHLKGYKHQLRSLKHYDPAVYDSISYKPKYDIENNVFDILKKVQFLEGLGKMSVEKEEFVGTTKDMNREAIPSTSRGLPSTSRDNIGFTDYERTTIPDSSKSDYYCKICQSHMNSEAMWQSHIRGKRHLANMKKHPGDRPSKTRTVPLPNAKPYLYDLIKRVSPIIGLDQVMEIQIPETGSSNYQCYLCGSSCSAADIVDHLMNTKHMLKYLQYLNYPGLGVLEGMKGQSLSSLITHMAHEVQNNQGPGTPSVHVTKSSLKL